MTWFAKICVIAAATAAYLPGAAAATECARWDLSGPFVIRQQPNIMFTGGFDHSGETLLGDAEWRSKTFEPGRDVTVWGKISGTVVGRQVRFQISWKSAHYKIGIVGSGRTWNSTGVYEGTLQPKFDDGKFWTLRGTVYAATDPGNVSDWIMQEAVACAGWRESSGPGMEDGTDRPGADYRKFELNGQSPEVCQKHCMAELASCRAWTYVRRGVQGPKAVCYLKSSVPPATKNACCISGVLVDGDRANYQGPIAPPPPPNEGNTNSNTGGIAGIRQIEDNTDRPGSDFNRIILNEQIPQACRAACLGNANCRAWTMVRAGLHGPTAVCYLKNPAPAPVPNTCCVSGTVKR